VSLFVAGFERRRSVDHSHRRFLSGLQWCLLVRQFARERVADFQRGPAHVTTASHAESDSVRVIRRKQRHQSRL